MTVLDGLNETEPWQAGRQGGRVRLAVWSDPRGSELLATAGSDGSLAVWVLNPDGTATAGAPLRGHEAGIFSVTFGYGPQGLCLFSAGTDCSRLMAVGGRRGGSLFR
jgi:WD40 repeat protein